MIGVSYPEWIDYCWIASDRDGHVAAFSTGGIGPVPVKALEYNKPRVIEGSAILKTPIITTACPAISFEEADDEVLDMAKWGFFTYDWSDVHRSRKAEFLRAYEPTAAPADPITVDMLPAELARIAAAARFANVAFSLNELLDVRAHLECCETERE